MFDIGFAELAVIAIIALMVVGPERMPGLIRSVGQWVGNLQRLAREVRRQLDIEVFDQPGPSRGRARRARAGAERGGADAPSTPGSAPAAPAEVTPRARVAKSNEEA